jgi:hypothetical protein
MRWRTWGPESVLKEEAVERFEARVALGCALAMLLLSALKLALGP